MNISLGEFERRHNIAKGTVSKKARELGFDTSQGLSPEAYEAMKGEFKVCDRTSPRQAKGLATTTFSIPSPGTLALPQQPEKVALGNIGGGQLADFQPEDIGHFLAACDGFQEAVTADWERQKQLAARKSAAAQQVAAKVAEVRQAATLYQARSDAAAMRSQQLDQDLATGMAELGKYTVAPGGDA